MNDDKLAMSKSYIYMPKGLSQQLSSEFVSNQIGSQENLKNYRSAFFENDKDLEDYNKQLKEALMA